MLTVRQEVKQEIRLGIPPIGSDRRENKGKPKKLLVRKGGK